MLLLVLRILLDFNTNASYKHCRFFKTYSKKGLEFVPNIENSIIVFNLSFVLLLIEVDPIIEKQSCKKNTFRTNGIGIVKIVFVLLTKVVVLYI